RRRSPPVAAPRRPRRPARRPRHRLRRLPRPALPVPGPALHRRRGPGRRRRRRRPAGEATAGPDPGGDRMRVLIWHVHGSWTTAFVQGEHTYLVPVLPSRGPEGRGRAQTYTWPDTVVEVTPAQLADEAV